MKTRRSASACAAVAIGVSALLAPTVAAATSRAGVTGNAAAIAYYRGAVATTNALPVLRDVYHGFYWLYDDARTAGPTSAFLLDWGIAKRPASYYLAATGTVVVRLVRSRVSWYTLTVAPSCPSGDACGSSVEPLELDVTKQGVSWGYLRHGNVPACWNRAAGTSAWLDRDFSVQPSGWWRTEGDYRPIVQHGNAVLITATYPASDGAKVTETDSINATTKRFVSSDYHVSRSTHRPVVAAHHFTISESDPKTTPKPPRLHLCR